MKKKKTKIGIIIILGLVLFIPRGNSMRETVYLNPNESTYNRFTEGLREETVQWSFRTFDEPFIVVGYYFSTNDKTISSDKTSNSGSLRLTSDIVVFIFRNIDTIGGYITVDIHIQVIAGYNLIIVLSIILILSIISIKRLKRN